MPVSLPDNIILHLGEALNTVPLHLILVKPGRFLMGSNAENAEDDEKPAHVICITNPFYIGMFPVTQTQWSAVFPGHNPARFKGPNLAVERISWHDIVDGAKNGGPPEAFLTRINRQLENYPEWNGYAFRLPTEAEWEYAAKGGHLGEQTSEQNANSSDLYPTYSGGDDLNRVGWYEDNNDINPHPLGRKQANQLGLYDLSGNVSEWCGDVYNRDAYQERMAKETEDPIGLQTTETDTYRIMRGGAWFLSTEGCRSSRRLIGGQEDRRNFHGFRLVLAPG